MYAKLHSFNCRARACRRILGCGRIAREVVGRTGSSTQAVSLIVVDASYSTHREPAKLLELSTMSNPPQSSPRAPLLGLVLPIGALLSSGFPHLLDARCRAAPFHSNGRRASDVCCPVLTRGSFSISVASACRHGPTVQRLRCVRGHWHGATTYHSGAATQCKRKLIGALTSCAHWRCGVDVCVRRTGAGGGGCATVNPPPPPCCSR